MTVSITILLTFVCTAVNHLGLVAAAERVIRHSLPILNCVKCCTFWAVLVYGAGCWLTDSGQRTTDQLVVVLAVALLSALAARWLELAMGGIDILYNKVYDTFYPADAPGADAKEQAGSGTADTPDTDGTVSAM